MDDEHFSSFSRFHPWMTSVFHRLFVFIHGWRAVFHENHQFTIVFEHLFLKIVDLLSYLSSFSWKHTIYYRIWASFFENLQFTIVFEYIFLKTYNLLSYLSNFFWKSTIYPRIWIDFPENRRFTPVSEWFFCNFSISSADDEQFSVFFARRLQAKRYFLRFLHFAHERDRRHTHSARQKRRSQCISGLLTS